MWSQPCFDLPYYFIGKRDLISKWLVIVGIPITTDTKTGKLYLSQKRIKQEFASAKSIVHADRTLRTISI